MKIESYEPYHIGIKIDPSVDFNILKVKLKEKLKKKKYTLSKEFDNAYSAPLPLQTELLGTKNSTRIELNFAVHALNTVGKDPKITTKDFKEVIDDILPSMGYEIDAVVSFYEIVTNVTVETTKPPIDFLNKSSRINISSLKDMGDVALTGIRISNKLPKEESFNLIIQPSIISPKSRISMIFSFRSKEKDKIISFEKTLEKKIQELISSLEK